MECIRRKNLGVVESNIPFMCNNCSLLCFATRFATIPNTLLKCGHSKSGAYIHKTLQVETVFKPFFVTSKVRFKHGIRASTKSLTNSSTPHESHSRGLAFNVRWQKKYCNRAVQLLCVVPFNGAENRTRQSSANKTRIRLAFIGMSSRTTPAKGETEDIHDNDVWTATQCNDCEDAISPIYIGNPGFFLLCGDRSIYYTESASN